MRRRSSQANPNLCFFHDCYDILIIELLFSKQMQVVYYIFPTLT